MNLFGCAKLGFQGHDCDKQVAFGEIKVKNT